MQIELNENLFTSIIIVRIQCTLYNYIRENYFVRFPRTHALKYFTAQKGITVYIYLLIYYNYYG